MTSEDGLKEICIAIPPAINTYVMLSDTICKRERTAEKNKKYEEKWVLIVQTFRI